MIVELRVYHCAPGRLPALHERFIRSTLGFFKKHGIEPVGFWTTLVGPTNQSLSYLLSWQSLAEREARWAAFQADEEWIAARAESEASSPIVERIENQFWTPTEYSSMR
ncbi:NIPSNAP family protein [Pseudomonas gingeri]|uniref:NIPSNAP family protein n=1 Tax=Pseudomonas gingeri TaxID=117681 RepID=UPI0015A4B888|nr:NIPSNAP family protein [Pseudomonas gingeri]NWD04136.1 NIPSNAP family protein [Pseudomonas gingeri]NWE34232.1 NIPSNAP family protein [Pseudomonas gingeri]NWE56516.1 NIPSNAP family protein [Pseudomonas gingeri]NWF05732.1 NIPSNAP family protein [Pseudomonas gingeri]